MTETATRAQGTKAAHFERVGYVPHEGQWLVHRSRARHRVTRWGRRGGKTFLGGHEVDFWYNKLTPASPGLDRRPPHFWIVGPNYTDCEKEFRVAYDTLRGLGVDKHSIKFVNNRESGNMHIRTSWGFEVECRSAAHPETLVGESLDGVLMVEAGRHKWKTWTEYIRPALSDRRGWSLHSGVPEGSSYNSLLYQLWNRGQSAEFKQWASWKFPSWVNTRVFPGGIRNPEIQEAKLDLTNDEFARQYEAEFVEQSGAVMKEWDDEVHLADLTYNPALPLYAACDYGYTNPFVWLWIQVDASGRLTGHPRVHVLGEYVAQFKDTVEVAADLKQDRLRSALRVFYPDPAEPDDTRILERELRVQSGGGTGGPLANRIGAIRRALKHHPDDLNNHPPRLYVDRNRCPRLVWEMREGYRWPEKRSEIRNDSEAPLDKDNHAVEALGRFFAGYEGASFDPGGVSKATVSRGTTRKPRRR